MEPNEITVAFTPGRSIFADPGDCARDVMGWNYTIEAADEKNNHRGWARGGLKDAAKRVAKLMAPAS